MNETVNPDYTFATATLEILLLLTAAFILGALLCQLLKAVGLCCRPRAARRTSYDHEPDAIMLARARAQKPAPTAGSTLPAQDMAYEADLRSLLRGRQDEGQEQAKVASSAPSSFSSRIQQATEPVISKTPTSKAATLDLPDEKHVDDLKKLEGIGPKIEVLLNNAGIRSYVKLATMDRDELKAILEAAGGQYKMHEPKSWPYQAELAAKQNWSRLKEYQDFLISGQKDV